MRRNESSSKPETRSAEPETLVPLLLTWFQANARDLPWRRTTDPYAIWVSEIMLQQTQVKTVIPYWERWMRELPSVQALAEAPPERIHKLWEGLGYYTRVRNLQKAARQIVAQPGGSFPDQFENILALPGIGRYTAGAICSIAFNQPAPIVDGNIIRVLTRIFGIAENPREKATNTRLWQLARELVEHASRIPHPASRLPCSALNQSLMELGALVCTPRSPSCTSCPAQSICLAFRENRIAALPNLGKRDAAVQRRFAAFIFEHDGKFLVRQRPAGVVNAHLWEFPNVECDAAADPRNMARGACGFTPKSMAPLCAIKHSITRYRITLEAFIANGVRAKRPVRPGHRWLELAELEKLSFPSAHKKILHRLILRRSRPV